MFRLNFDHVWVDLAEIDCKNSHKVFSLVQKNEDLNLLNIILMNELSSQAKFRLCWNLRAAIDRMVKGRTDSPWFRGKMENLWSGTSLARILWQNHTLSATHAKRVLLHKNARVTNDGYTEIWNQTFTSCPFASKHWGPSVKVA